MLACPLANGIKHVIIVQFDNTHSERDNPNVPSDLEQIPALRNFITSNGTLLTDDHTVLISHTSEASSPPRRACIRTATGHGRKHLPLPEATASRAPASAGVQVLDRPDAEARTHGPP